VNSFNRVVFTVELALVLDRRRVGCPWLDSRSGHEAVLGQELADLGFLQLGEQPLAEDFGPERVTYNREFGIALLLD